LLGHNGAGKSTIYAMICGITPTTQDGQKGNSEAFICMEFKLGTTAKEADEKINAAFGQGCSTKLGTTAKEADEKINAAFGQRCSTIRTAYRWYQGGTRRSTPHSVKDVPQFGRRIVGIRSCGMEMNAAFGQGCSTIRTAYRSIKIFGNELSTNLAECRSFMGLCPQVNCSFKYLTVDEHLWFYFKLKGGEGYWKEEADTICKRLNMEGFRKRKHEVKRFLILTTADAYIAIRASKLSYGEKRKLSIAQAFIANSQLVILDEPTAGMDPQSRRDVEEFVAKEKAKRRSGIFLLHKTPVIERHLDRATLTREFTSNVRLPSDAIADPRCMKLVVRTSAVPLISMDPASFTSVSSTQIFRFSLGSNIAKRSY
uniref:ABC transporter domain-containing protein n=1 Tax=Heligmosomoides polygyrus TaxID=6339 RepID=A0A183GFV7_HELPZ